jgi:hypothetical protein
MVFDLGWFSKPGSKMEDTQQAPADPAGGASATENNNAEQAAQEAAAPPNPLLDKYNQDWKVVQERPQDFQAWTTLITSAEKLVCAVPHRDASGSYKGLVAYRNC